MLQALVQNSKLMVNINVFRIGPVIEPKKLLVHGSLVESAVKLVASYIYNLYIIKIKNNYKILKYI